MIKYNTYPITTEKHCPPYKSSKNNIKFYKKGKKPTLYETGAIRYVWLYALLIWVVIYNCMYEH